MSAPTPIFWNEHRNEPGEHSVQALLEDTSGRVAREHQPKALVLLLDDANGEDYVVAWAQAGMTFSQCIALMEYVQHAMLRRMQEQS